MATHHKQQLQSAQTSYWTVSRSWDFRQRLLASSAEGLKWCRMLTGTSASSDTQVPRPSSSKPLKNSVLCSCKTYGSFHLLLASRGLSLLLPFPYLLYLWLLNLDLKASRDWARPTLINSFWLIQSEQIRNLNYKIFHGSIIKRVISHPIHRFFLLSRNYTRVQKSLKILLSGNTHIRWTLFMVFCSVIFF